MKNADLNSSKVYIYRFGYWLSILLTMTTIIALAIAINTPPRSGPFCQADCITYPYTDAAQYVPRDYLWMYPAILMAPIFFIVLICIHQLSSVDKKLFSQIAVSFSIISAVVLSVDYMIQLAVMQPSFIKGELDSLSLWSQYNPHGIFIALEDLGYLMMSFSFLFMSFVFSADVKIERSIKRILQLSFILGIGSLILLAAIYGYNLEYLFECAIILINWLTLIPIGILLAIYFGKGKRAV
jgi:hypothetical protein